MIFLNCAVFELNYLTETGEKPLRIKLDNTCSEFLKDLGHKTFLKLSTEPTLAGLKIYIIKILPVR